MNAKMQKEDKNKFQILSPQPIKKVLDSQENHNNQVKIQRNSYQFLKNSLQSEKGSNSKQKEQLDNSLSEKNSAYLNNKPVENQQQKLTLNNTFLLQDSERNFKKEEVQNILDEKMVLIKRGKIFGRPVYRWCQLSINGKLLYFKKKDQRDISGQYSLYQCQSEKREIQNNQILQKLVKESREIVNFEVIELTMPSFKNKLFIIPNQIKLCDQEDDEDIKQLSKVDLVHNLIKLCEKGTFCSLLCQLQLLNKRTSVVFQSQYIQPSSIVFKTIVVDNSQINNNNSLYEEKDNLTSNKDNSLFRKRIQLNDNYSRNVIEKDDQQEKTEIIQQEYQAQNNKKNIPNALILSHTRSKASFVSNCEGQKQENQIFTNRSNEYQETIKEEENKSPKRPILSQQQKKQVQSKQQQQQFNPFSPFSQNINKEVQQQRSFKFRKMKNYQQNNNFILNRSNKKQMMNNQMKTTINRGDLDEVSGMSDEESQDQKVNQTQQIISMNLQKSMYSNYKGRVMHFDDDIGTNSIMMEYNPVETLQKINDSIGQEIALNKLGINVNFLKKNLENDEYDDVEASVLSMRWMEGVDEDQANQKQHNYGERLFTVQNMDSNLNSVKGDFSSLSISEQVKLLQDDNLRAQSLYCLEEAKEKGMGPSTRGGVGAINAQCQSQKVKREQIEEIIKQILEENQEEDNELEQLATYFNHEQVSMSSFHSKPLQGFLQLMLFRIQENVLKMKRLAQQDAANLSTVEALYKGIESSWNFEFLKAKSIFAFFTEKGDFRHYLHKIEVYMFQVLITGKKSIIDKCFLKILRFEQRLIQIKAQYTKNKQTQVHIPHKPIKINSSKIVINSSSNISNQGNTFQSIMDYSNLNSDIYFECFELIQAETLMFKGILRFLAGNKFKAFLIFRECWKIYKKFEPIYLKIYDPNFKGQRPSYFDGDFESRLLLGLGLFYLGISALPRSLSAIIRIVGFTGGNREKGKQFLEKCIADKRCRSPYAALILALFYIDQDPNLERVCLILKEFIQAYPHSSLFHWISSIISWKLAQLDDAVFFIERALITCPENLAKEAAFLKQTNQPNFYRYEIGWFHYLKMEYDQSLIRFKEVLRDCLDLEIEEEDEDLEKQLIESQITDNLKNSSENQGNNHNNNQDKANQQVKGKGNNEMMQNLVKKFHATNIQSEVPLSNQVSPVKDNFGNSPLSEDRQSQKRQTKKGEDFVYLPHRACLAMQIAGTYVALKRQVKVTEWLQATIGLANQPGLTRSKLDQEMGHLAYIYLNYRKINDLLTFEITYFLHQMPKLPNSILLQIISQINDTLKKISISLNCQDPVIYKDSPYFPEYVSGMMLTIVCYCFLGDSDIACLFSERLLKSIQYLPQNFSYMAVHSLYWAARSLMAENHYKQAESLLQKTKKYKKYEFQIDSKIDKVLGDLKIQISQQQ